MASSAIPRISAATLPYKNVLDYGAVADDATDCTAAFNAAIQAAGPDGTVYVPRGIYLIRGQIEMNSGGVTLPDPWGLAWPSKLVGDGRQLSTLHIPSVVYTSNLQTDATIHAAVGVTITDLRFIYDQPNVATYGTFNQYKPVIKLNINYRTIPPTPTKDLGARFMRLRIERAWDGIQAYGATVGSASMGRDIFEDIEISMLNKGFDLDGYATFTRMDKIHVYPFGMITTGVTNNLPDAFQLQNRSVALYIGNHPYVTITDSVFLNGTGLITHGSTLPFWSGKGPFLHFDNCKWDTYSAIKIGVDSPTQGGVKFTQCAIAPGPQMYGSCVSITSGPVQFTGCGFAHLGPPSLNQPLIDNQSDDPVELSNCAFDMNDHDKAAIFSSGRVIQISNCSFVRKDDGTDYTSPAISISSGKAIVTGNFCRGVNFSSGVFLKLTSNEYHIVSGNTAIGWTIAWPTGSNIVQGFGNQTESATGAPGQNLFLSVKQLVLEGGTSNNLKVLTGAGSPQSVVTADPGSLFLSTSGSHYVKKTGTGNTGWSIALS